LDAGLHQVANHPDVSWRNQGVLVSINRGHLQGATLNINAADFAIACVIHKLGIRHSLRRVWLIELFKHSKKDEAHNEPDADFLEHIVVQIPTFAGLIREFFHYQTSRNDGFLM
jgi:hypothetical protein